MKTKPKIFTSKILEINDLTPSVKDLKLSIPDDLKFKAGQYFSMSVPREDGKKIRKPFSVSNMNQNNGEIEIIAKIIEGGLASEFIKKLGEEDRVELFGPLGKFTIDKEDDSWNNDLFFVASGVGLAPFLSIIPDILNKGFKNKIILLKSARNEDEVLYDKELSQFSEKYDNFEFYNVLSQPKNENFENVGYVQDFINKYLPSDFNGYFYVCGLQNMINSTRKKLKEKDIEGDRIKVEKFD